MEVHKSKDTGRLDLLVPVAGPVLHFRYGGWYWPQWFCIEEICFEAIAPGKAKEAGKQPSPSVLRLKTAG